MNAEIVALDRAWEDAIMREDAAVLDRLASDDLIYTHAGGSVEGKAGFINHVVNGSRRFVAIVYEDLAVRLRGEAAVLTCALHLNTVDRDGQPGELHFRTTHVWVVEDGGWRLIANQSTHIPAAS